MRGCCGAGGALRQSPSLWTSKEPHPSTQPVGWSSFLSSPPSGDTQAWLYAHVAAHSLGCQENAPGPVATSTKARLEMCAPTPRPHSFAASSHITWSREGHSDPPTKLSLEGWSGLERLPSSKKQPRWAKTGVGGAALHSDAAAFQDLGMEEDEKEVRTVMLGSGPGVQRHNLVLMFSFSKDSAWSLRGKFPTASPPPLLSLIIKTCPCQAITFSPCLLQGNQ